MSDDPTNFRSWYKDILQSLFPNRDAGFVILLVVFPLLERYLRQKAGLKSESNLTEGFYDELFRLFPELKTRDGAKTFWQIYRNGLLHEITLSRKARTGTPLPVGWVSHDKPIIAFEFDESVWVNPVHFANRVIAVIESDFATFAGGSTPLPTEKTWRTGTQTSYPPATQSVILGTNTDR